MSIDSIGDFLTAIRNIVLVSKPFVVVPCTKTKFIIAEILKKEGFVKDIVLLDGKSDTEHGKRFMKIILKYVDNESVIHEIKRISKPGRRVYVGVKGIKPVIGGLGLSILTTNCGVLTHKEAKNRGVGGEVICTVW